MLRLGDFCCFGCFGGFWGGFSGVLSNLALWLDMLGSFDLVVGLCLGVVSAVESWVVGVLAGGWFQ